MIQKKLLQASLLVLIHRVVSHLQNNLRSSFHSAFSRGKMPFLAVLIVFRVISAIAASEERYFNFLLGSDVELKCTSSFIPSWNKFGPAMGEFHIIGLNGRRHPNWKESRYSFSDQGEEYSLRIADVRLSDAGKFVCGSEKPVTFVVTVVG